MRKRYTLRLRRSCGILLVEQQSASQELRSTWLAMLTLQTVSTTAATTLLLLLLLLPPLTERRGRSAEHKKERFLIAAHISLTAPY